MKDDRMKYHKQTYLTSKEFIVAVRKQRFIEAEDLYRFQLLSEPRISPDGQCVVYVQQRVDRKTEKKYSNLWIAGTHAGKPRQFTYGDQNDTHPRWSPDGSEIAFLSDRADKDKPAQIYIIPIGGGEARQLTSLEATIHNFSWSPDGKKLLCSIRKADPEQVERWNDEQKKELDVVYRQYDRLFYKLDGYGYLPHERTHIWIVDARTGKSKQLTDHPVWDENDPAWSPDGKQIAFTSNVSPDPDLEFYKTDLFVMPVSGGEKKKLPAPVGNKTKPSFSPDGRWIAFFGSENQGEDYKNQSLWIVPADGSTQACDVLAPYDLNASPWTINDMGSPEEMQPTWSNDSQRIYFTVSQHGSSLLMSVSRDGSDLQTVIGAGGVVGSYSFDRSQDWLAYFYGTLSDPGQVYLKDMQTGATNMLTSINQELLNEINLGQIEEVWFQGPAGNDLQGWILKPPDFDPDKKYPSIQEIHGGPYTQYGNFFMHEFYYLAAHGYVVYFTNPRGSKGYGEAHTKAIYQGWGDADYADLMAWNDYVAAQPFIDTRRMGVTGGSYGGYMTVWIIGHTQRFRAAVTQRCVSNFVSMWGSSDFNWSFQKELNDKPPFQDLEKYWKHSPIAYIGNATTPTLVIHSEMDLRCPIEQGEQVFVALKTLGVDSEMVRFPDEFHGLSRTGRTDRRIARLEHILGWFEKYLK
jgi:dipeptidyl aminopeptidase/acylaminoacyl peptidase